MLNRFLYRTMYWLGISDWDTGETPPEVQEAFRAGDIPPGAVLDLGCGTGTNVVFMAQQGRHAIGLDFAPRAVQAARRKAQEAGLDGHAQFHVADVTRLTELQLPPAGFALDMGCFHGLSPDGQRRYAEGLANTLIPGGQYMLYTLDPRKEAGFSFGLQPEAVRSVFTPRFDILRMERNASPSPGSTWFWMKRKAPQSIV